MNDKKHGIFKLRFDRLLSQSLWRQLLILGGVLLVMLAFSYLLLSFSGADWKAFSQSKDVSQWLLPVYLLIDTNALNTLYIEGHVHGWMLFASSITFLLGAFIFNGIIIGIITNTLEQRVADHRKGRIHYLRTGHYIILGYDDMAPSIINHIFSRDASAYVLLMGAMDAEVIREKLCKRFDEQQMKHIIINYGHRTSPGYLKDIHLESAKEVFVVGNHSKPEHDAINVECVDCMRLYLADKQERPSRITVVFKDLDTYAAFKTSPLFKDISKLGIEFTPYNRYAGWAKQVFVKRGYRDFGSASQKYPYPSVFGKKGILPQDERYAHLVFVGTTNFAVAFAMEAAHVLHFPNYPEKGVRTRITFIDLHADKEKDEFITRNRHFFEVQSHYYRDLSDASSSTTLQRIPPLYFNKDNGYEEGADYDFLDVEFEFIKGDVFSQRVQQLIRTWAGEHEQKQYLSVFLAMADQRQNFVMAMNMPDEVYDHEVPLFVRQDRSDNFVTQLREADSKTLSYCHMEGGELKEEQRHARYASIYPFGMNETAYSADDHSLRRAMLINYLYCHADYDTLSFPGMLTLDSIAADDIWAEARALWQKLDVSLKWSNLYNSYTIRTKLRTLRAMRGMDIEDESRDGDLLSDEETAILAQVEHNRWNVEKLLMGYRKPHRDEDKYEYDDYSAELSKNKKLYIHHDIRPFDKLDKISKLDYEFSGYMPWIMRMTEKQ